MSLALDHLVTLQTLRSLSTVLVFITFIGICLWAYSRNRRDDFEQAANLPFADDSTFTEPVVAESAFVEISVDSAREEKL